MRMRLLGLVLLLTSSPAVSACGGGGGGGGGGGAPPASLLAGPYHFGGMFALVPFPGGVGANWGLLTSDSMGNASGSVTQNANGTVVGPSAGTITYTVSAARELSLRTSGSSPMEYARGGIRADGGVAVAGTSVLGPGPALYTLLRREGTFTLMSINGTYHVLGCAYDPAGPTNLAYFGTATFDGLGGGSLTTSINGNGSIIGPLGAPASYTVAADGTLTVTFGSGGATLAGGVLQGGQLAVAAGGTAPGDEPGLFVFLRQATSATNATLSGTYFAAGVAGNVSGGDQRSLFGTIVANGAGSATANLTVNDGVAIVPDVPTPVPYSVSANGLLTITAGDTFTGAVLADGSIAVICGGTNAGAEINFFFLVR